MNTTIEEIQNIIGNFKSLRQKARETNLLQMLEKIYKTFFQESKEEREIIEEKELENLIKPLSIHEFFSVYQKVRGFAIVKFYKENGDRIYGLQKELLKSDIEAVKSLITCEELDNPELAEKLYFEMLKRYNQAISIIEDFYNTRLGEYEFGLISRLGDILEQEISDYFA